MVQHRDLGLLPCQAQIGYATHKVILCRLHHDRYQICCTIPVLFKLYDRRLTSIMTTPTESLGTVVSDAHRTSASRFLPLL
jgi:hypothetical protein